MMNRYITALLVVLTATGLEAQAYQSALKAARGGDVALEELCRHSAFQGKEAEILSFIRAIKSVEQRDDQEPAHAPWVAQVDSEGPGRPRGLWIVGGRQRRGDPVVARPHHRHSDSRPQSLILFPIMQRNGQMLLITESRREAPWCAPWCGATSPPQRVIHNKKRIRKQATK